VRAKPRPRPAKTSKAIRVLALCVFRKAGRILAAEGFDRASKEHFYRPFGGGVEFSETASAALRREIREELGAEIASLKLLGVLENHFEFEKQHGHEIVFVFDARFRNPRIYRQTTVLGIEERINSQLVGKWLRIADIKKGAVTVYPAGLAKLL
jgi:ADP-ribose pyrophosphatase YjhB (NUDIX family)